MKVLKLGLVGKDVSKSQSENIHRFILREMGVALHYERFSIPPDNVSEFDGVIRRLMGDFDGFNVTIPYKRDIMEYLDEVVDDAMDFGAVNTVVTATAKGYNTDGMGFLQMLSVAKIEVKDKKILVLGGGGAGRSTAVALRKAGGKVWLYQRNRRHLLETCNELRLTPANSGEEGGFDILVNSTGVGMHDSEGRSPVTEKAFDGASVAIDLIYTPKQTEFLRLGKEKGLATLNGEAMLFYQAYYADCLFLQIPPDSKQAETLYQKYLQTLCA